MDESYLCKAGYDRSLHIFFKVDADMIGFSVRCGRNFAHTEVFLVRERHITRRFEFVSTSWNFGDKIRRLIDSNRNNLGGDRWRIHLKK